MDLREKDKFVLDRDSENHLNYNPSGISADWQMGCVPTSNSNNSISMGVGQATSCPSASMVDSFSCSTLWDDHSSNPHNLGISLNTTTTNASNNVHIIKPIPPPSRLDMGGWNPSDHISKDGVFQQTSIGILPPGGLSSQFPSDSTFIEQAARLSCFGSGTFTSMLSPFDTSNSYFTQSRRSDPNILEGHNRSNGEGSPMNSQKDTTSSKRVGEHGNTEFNGGGSGQEEIPLEKSVAKKRKRNTQEIEIGQPMNDKPTEISKENNGVGHKYEPNASSPLGAKNNGKQAKDGGDPAKEDYIHVRARRGQATNSHSLAERVRREKISERMKFLQDLVPGCSKVTGKAVMLDEIINYVQSLQRQVEFLSMKLATVNPQLDFNLEGFVSKDIRAGTSSAIGFTPDLAHHFLNPTSQGGLAQSGVFGVGPPSPDAFRRAINGQLNSPNTFKEAKHQMGISCDDDIQNILSQMGFGNNLPLNIQQDSNDKTRSSDGFTM